MPDINQIRSTIEQAVSRRSAEHLERFRGEIIDQILREIEPLLGSGQTHSATHGSPASDILNATISSIQEATAQADILKALLEGVSKFAARSALFVVRGTMLVGWQGRGFTDDTIRGLNLDGSKGLAARAIDRRGRVSAGAIEFDPVFTAKQGIPADGNATVFPLVVKDKVAALLYCDSGTTAGHHSDYSAIEVLTRFTCLWLEQAAVRKHISGAEPGAPATAAASAGPSTMPSYAAAAPARAPSTTTAVAEPAIDNLPPEEQDLHKKARRFAKLLVDEIKLYNQGKVAEGKQNREVYKLLREDIEKSRATYDKRYGSSPVASAKYFDVEVVRILADNDRSLMGSDFPG